MKYLSKLFSILSIISLLLPFSFSYAQTLPIVPALFDTALSAPQYNTDTTITLASSGTIAANDVVCLTVDSNLTSLEYECGVASSSPTTIMNITRGIDLKNGTSSISSNIFYHRRGADIRITDFPSFSIITSMLNGSSSLPYTLIYSSSLSTSTINTNRNKLASVGLVQDTAFNAAGLANANATQRGLVQLATGLQLASSTGICSSGAACVLSADNSTSTYNAATAPLKVVVTQNNGKIDPNFISSSGLSFSTTTIIGSFPAYQIGKNYFISTTTGTSTFTIPSGITKLYVKICGAGGGGGGGDGSHTNAAGGASGGYTEGFVDVTGTSTVQYFIGTGGTAGSSSAGGPGTWTTFGTNGFYLSANPGTGGGEASASATVGGIGGTSAGGNLNITGQNGSSGITGLGGKGGDSLFGFGGASPASVGGISATGFCSGGSGSGNTGNNGGGGTNGIMYISW